MILSLLNFLSSLTTLNISGLSTELCTRAILHYITSHISILMVITDIKLELILRNETFPPREVPHDVFHTEGWLQLLEDIHAESLRQSPGDGGDTGLRWSAV